MDIVGGFIGIGILLAFEAFFIFFVGVEKKHSKRKNK